MRLITVCLFEILLTELILIPHY